MDLLMHNPIANMYGPHFLILYGVVIVLTLFVAWKTIQAGQKTRGEVFLYGLIVILGLGGYKLIVALSKGFTNVTFLLVFGVIGFLLLSRICSSSESNGNGYAGGTLGVSSSLEVAAEVGAAEEAVAGVVEEEGKNHGQTFELFLFCGLDNHRFKGGDYCIWINCCIGGNV